MPSRKRRDLLLVAGGMAAAGLAGCSEYVRSTRNDGNETDGSEPGADAPDSDSGSDSDTDSDSEPDAEDDTEPEAESAPAELRVRTERVMDELRWYRSKHAPNRSQYLKGLNEIKAACNDLIEAGTGGNDTLNDLETAYEEFSAAVSVLSTRYPYAADVRDDIGDEVETLLSAGAVTDNPAGQTNVVEIAKDLRDESRRYIAEANEGDVLSADVLSGAVYEYLQSETVRESSTTPVFELRVSLKRNVGGPQGVFFAGAHPSDLDDDLDGNVFRDRNAGSGGPPDYERPLQRFVPFVDAVEFDQEAVVSFGDAADGGTYRAITDVSLQVLEHRNEQAATDAVETIIAELDAERKTSIDLDTGEETYDYSIGGHDWTMIEYDSWKDDWEAGSDLTWRCLLLTAGRFVLVFDPYLAEAYGEDRWEDMRYTWVWQA